jgi:hypothetical protein
MKKFFLNRGNSQCAMRDPEGFFVNEDRQVFDCVFIFNDTFNHLWQQRSR